MHLVGTKPVRVVVVDDHDDLRMLVALLLDTDERFDVIGEATTGREGVRLVEETLPDLMLLDLAMPDMDGLEVMEVCLERWPGLPAIVVLSGFTSDAMLSEVLGRGAIGYVEKGSAFGAEVVDQVFAMWEAHIAGAPRPPGA